VITFIAELSPFRGNSEKDNSQNSLVTQLSSINNLFGDDAEEQRVFIAVTEKLFETTSVFYKRQFFLFLFGFMIPFICQIFYCSAEWSVWLLNSICMATQVIFFLLEMVQFKIKGKKYFEMWNIIDCFNSLLYACYFVARMRNTESLLPRM
jgi:hypothetical protein